MSDVVKIGEAGVILGCHSKTVKKLIDEGAFPNAFRLRHSWRIPMRELESYMAKQIKEAKSERKGSNQPPAPSKPGPQNVLITEGSRRVLRKGVA